MATREAAVAAMDALDEKHTMEGSTTTIAVKWADPELQIKKRRALEDSNAENRMVSVEVVTLLPPAEVAWVEDWVLSNQHIRKGDMGQVPYDLLFSSL